MTNLAPGDGVLWAVSPAAPDPPGGHGLVAALDATTLELLHSWPVGGDPVAVSAAGTRVWVANGFGDGSSVVSNANTVMEMDAADGRILHTYPVANPGDVLAESDGAAVVTSEGTANGPVSVFRLTGGAATEVATAPATVMVDGAKTLATAGGSVYALLSTYGTANLSLRRIEGSALVEVARLGSGGAALTCGGDYCFVAVDNADDGGVFRVALPGGATEGPWASRYSSGASLASGVVWVLTAGATVRALDAATGGDATGTLSLPGPGADLIASDDTGVWAVSNGTVLRIAAE